ncbi:Transcriptional regulator, contains XRE-family HTH domain [Streptoalloteichus hindustanus]|uniref:Transcriptional regulator, contains XRE-family HTH domain n=2 Tax=Streptoalloteichus hindustanus TaxID=2017 RepID=A0A1M5F4U6_STRHI|nr:Transcriptional regulator, contains XRE-family HTH domain [Streptoalloteichus hindustanus]
MPLDDDTHIGRAIARFRKAAGLNQHQLAARANISLSLLQKVEVGDRAANHSTIAGVARALHLPPEKLTGQPYTDHQGDEASRRHVDALRAVLRRYDLPADSPVRPVADLATDVAEISRLRRDADYNRLVVRLPALLDELTTAAHHQPDASEPWRLLCQGYFVTHNLLHRLGHGDLAEVSQDRLDWAAQRASDPLAHAVTAWARCTAFQAAGDYTHGLRLMDTARAELDDELRGQPSPEVLTVYGSLHLRAVTLASRAGDADTTHAHLRAARDLATQLGNSDQVHHGLTFGPANTLTHEVAAHVELGDAPAALEAARTWAPPQGMPRTRRGHHHIDLARAHLAVGDRAGALMALREAKRIAPQQTRLHPMVRETTAVLVSLHRRAVPELSRYATWLGLTS